MHFYGRHIELNFLQRMYESNKFSFIPISGRRGVGKSALISKFADNKTTILLENDDIETFVSDVSQLAKTLQIIEDSFLSKDLTKLFDIIYRISQKIKLLFIIDEFYFFFKTPKLLNKLQFAIDKKFKRTNIMIILAHSSLAFMKRHILGYESPLYGRRTTQLKISPFTFSESREFVSKYSLIEQALVYGVTGGVPRYLELFDSNNPLDENLIFNYFSPQGYLFLEPKNLFGQEFKDPGIHEDIVRIIANGATSFNEIKNKLEIKISEEKIKNCLTALITAEIVEISKPVIDGTSEHKGIYCIKDDMYNFWYNMVESKLFLINYLKGANAYQSVLPLINTFMGGIFEKICIQYMASKMDDLPFIPDKIGRWWGTNNKTKSQMEIDFIAISINNKEAIFGECKWSNQLVDKSEIIKLIEKAKYFVNFETKYCYLFSKTGFTERAKEFASENLSIKLFSLYDMFDHN
ncbi:MAG: AAA family ATPase [Christensenellaceae bacterium]|jgi:AAA+ ATPase superfamily predicted ATPase|nr:AAA family ATPase [Christensenellaceae bacterium]